VNDVHISTTPYREYAARGKNAWWRYAAAVALGLGLAILGPGLIILVGAALRLTPPNLAQMVQDPSHPIPFFLFTGGVFLAFLAAFVASIRLMHRKRFGDIIGAWRWRDFLAGFGIWALVLVGASLLDYAIAPKGFRFALTGQTPMFILVAGLTLAVQTFAEEFLFRGYATQGLLLATRRIAPTVILSGLLFGAMHITNGAPQAVSATIFGMILSVIAIATGGLAFTFGLHFANNLFGAVIVASTNDAFHGAPAVFSQHTPQLMWWDTAVGALALVVVTFVVLRRRQRVPAGE
jgi:membrane protease YdiL (CAAX protease family)